MLVIVNVEFEGKLRESTSSSFCCCSCRCLSCFICSIWRLTWYPAKRGGGGAETPVWAEEKPSILSVLKFDSEVQDPGRQKAHGGGGKEGRDGRSFSLFSDCDKSKLSKYAATYDQSKSGNMFLIERRRPLREITRTHLGLWSPVSVNCRNCCWMATGAKVSQ